MGLPFRQVKKLWLLYLFLLFFSFFMFALSINVYLQSLQTSDFRKSALGAAKHAGRVKSTTSVVVGHYIGTGSIFDNMTKAEYNVNDFNPIAEEGAMGRPVIIPAKDSLKMQRLFKINSFNIMASDKIPLNRTLKDYRMDQCREIQYNVAELPTTSVIIVFHNEAWSVLLRTVWSVITRSPEQLLKEIILIDDASDRDYLQKPLEEYIKTLPVRTKLFRHGERSGLVPARLLGAANAEGDVLTFLDAHCECSPGWLEPLLARIKEDKRRVVCPVIDIISDDNFGYTKTFENHWGAFNWHLSFRWFSNHFKDNENTTRPIRTPGMAGGLFSIDRGYFFDMGSYDEAMKIWGGENVEMSFRIWQCGGSIEIIPCSHVGHVFRKSTPYTFPGGVSETLSNNLARVAMVWMDEWQDFFFMYNSVKMELKNTLNVADRVELRQRLNCKPFAWYLKTVWPNNFFPSNDAFFGKIVWLNGKTELTKQYQKTVRNIPGRLVPQNMVQVFTEVKKYMDITGLLDLKKDSCLRSANQAKGSLKSVTSPLKVGDCLPESELYDMFTIISSGSIMTNNYLCVDYNDQPHRKPYQKSNVQLYGCRQHSSRQHWKYLMDTQQIKHGQFGLCLTVNDTVESLRLVSAETCNDNEVRQKWALIPLPWKFSGA